MLRQRSVPARLQLYVEAWFGTFPSEDCGMATNDKTNVNSMSAEELGVWLHADQGIPEKFCKAFEENYIDGAEFLKLSAAEVKDLIPPIGLAKKVLRLIVKDQPGPSSSFSPPPLSPTFPPLSPPGSECSRSTTSTARSSSELHIPDNWKEDTQECITSKVLDSDARNDICRTIVTLLTAKYGQGFGRACVEQAAMKLLQKYPFMADDIGTGYGSWVDKIIECHRNRVKSARKKVKKQTGDGGSTPKKSRMAASKDDLMRRYPITVHSTPDDHRSIEEHKKAITEELKKAKPRDSVLLPLLQSTFHERRMFIQSAATRVTEILDEYQVLHRPAMIEQEMAMIVNEKEIRISFEREWTSFVPGILKYGERAERKE